MSMLSGKGCPFHCNFCYRMDSGFRPRSTESIIAEMKVLNEQYRVNAFTFDDELMMSSIVRTKEIAQTIPDSGLKIKLWCQGRLNYASQDIEMLHLLKKAGCIFINYGIEDTLKAGISPGLNIIFGNLDEEFYSALDRANGVLFDDYVEKQ